MLDLMTTNDVVRSHQAVYTILNLIGRGGMGAVYRVRRENDASIWALKEMRPPPDIEPEELAENRRLFAQEAELLRSLNHPNLPVIADYFENDQRPVLVMEYVAGQTLEERLHEANAPLLEQQVIGYGIQLARVLHYLHTRTPPVIYRDLKPSNIILTPEGILKLIDFGVARQYKERKAKDTIAMGSAGYAPPEQYGKEQTDARSDIYALGATLLHMLTNLPPVPLQPPTPGYVRQFNPSARPATEQVVITAMQIDREQRFADCAAVERALMACLDAPYVDPTARVQPPPVVPPPAPQPAMPVPIGGNGANTPTVAPGRAPVMPQPAPEAGQSCHRCGRLNKARARFCSGCGTPLGGPPSARLLIRSQRGSWEKPLDRVPLRIGRRDPRRQHYPDIDLAEYDRGIASRNHAEIRREGDFFNLVDLGSTNGTYLNDVRIPPNLPQRLNQNDRIKIGEVEMTFRWS
jgi:eukaryotic-like serine/threonine-protein kinase